MSFTASGPLVSVIVPAYNYARYIGQTLDNVCAQAYANWECIVVDDGSTDRTSQVVKHYVQRDPRIKYVYQENRGLPGARNTGIRKSRGEFLQFLDADDLIEPQKLERQVAFLQQHPQIDIVYGAGRSFTTELSGVDDISLGAWLTWMPQIDDAQDNAVLALIRRPFVVHAALVRRRVITAVGLFKEELRACEDWQFWVRCAVAGMRFQFAPLAGTLALYRTHAASMCANPRLMRAGTRRLRREIAAIVTDEEALQLNRRMAAEFEGHAAVEEVRAQRIFSGAWQCLKTAAMVAEPRERLKWLYCSVAAFFAPKQQFETFIFAPVGQSVRLLLRPRRQRAS